MKHKQLLMAALAAFAPAMAFAQSPPQEIPFKAVDPIKMPAGQHLGEVSGVAVDK
jgi:hypothetical protein